MARWRFLITPQAEDDLANLDPPVQKRVVERIEWFVEHFEQVSPVPLGGNWKGFFKLRTGDWRIIYEAELENQRVIVHRIGRRDEIYKRRR
jgi:mRNA interferase RelE/StbE